MNTNMDGRDGVFEHPCDKVADHKTLLFWHAFSNCCKSGCIWSTALKKSVAGTDEPFEDLISDMGSRCYNINCITIINPKLLLIFH